jgi:TonB family protein
LILDTKLDIYLNDYAYIKKKSQKIILFMKTLTTFQFGLMALFIINCSFNVRANCIKLNKDTFIAERTDSLNQNINNDDLIYSVVEQMPSFPGGENELKNFIDSNLKYPVESVKNKEQGKVFLRFVVNKTGKIEKAEIIRSVSRLLDKEAYRVVNLLPDFIPGKQNGKNVNVYYTLPIAFKLGLK